MAPDIVRPVHFTAPHIFGVQLGSLSLHALQTDCLQASLDHA